MKRVIQAAVSVAAAVLVLGFTGCGTTGGSGGGGGDTNTVTGVTNAHARAVVWGLTAVDPNSYGGWAGDCPGCDIDADEFGKICASVGIETRVLHNSRATKAGIVAAAQAAFSGMTAGDLLVLYGSGHGGQVTDANGDEVDGLDETICLWDGQWVDDDVGALLEQVPAGVRVLFVTDTCESGTNFRHWYGVKGRRPAKYRHHTYHRAVPKGWACQMIHYGGCADGEYSEGGSAGGVLTLALRKTWNTNLTYKSWFDATATEMLSGTQVPAYEEYGPVTAAFRDGPALR